MKFSLSFIFLFIFSAFAANIEPGPFENVDYLSYLLVQGDLEYYLRQNIKEVKNCYNEIKNSHYNNIENFGWDLRRILDEGVYEKLGKNNQQKKNIKDAINILKDKIANRLVKDYLNPLWTKIQGLHFNEAAVHLDRFRDVIRENMEEYQKTISQLKSSKDVFNAVEGRLRGERANIKLWSEQVERNLTICMEKAICKS